MEFHLQQLERHCRVCGRRLCKSKGRAQPVYECTSHSSDLLTSFGVDVSGDDEQILPTKFCNPCYVTMKRAMRTRKDGIPYFHTITPFIWTEHTPSCTVSSTFLMETKTLHISLYVGLSALWKSCQGGRAESQSETHWKAYWWNWERADTAPTDHVATFITPRRRPSSTVPSYSRIPWREYVLSYLCSYLR